MLSRLVLCVAVAAALVAVPSASAAVTASNVSSPADGAGFGFDENNPGTFTVSGTATADNPLTDKVDLVCTYAGGQQNLASGVGLTPTGANTGTFTAQVSESDIDYFTCRVRAVPAGGAADLTPFTGPVVHGHGYTLYPVDAGHPNDLYDYYQDVSGPLGYWDGYSASHCFVSSTYTLDPATFGYAELFTCSNVGSPSGGDPAGTRAAVQLDGRDAYLPAIAFNNITPTGLVPITDFARSLDPSTGDTTLSGTEHLMSCANGSTTFPATGADCPSWTDTGLTDRATTVGDHGGRLVRHTDTWTNPGATPRRLDVWYAVSATGTWFEFPGEADYAQHADGDHSGSGGTIPTPPAGASSVLLASAPTVADYQNPRGSVTWSGPPAEIRFAGGTMYLDFQRTIPAGGTAAITLAFATDGPQANVDSLTADAQAAMPKPSVAFASPADGATVNANAITVTGTSAGDGPLAVSVNGHAASVSGNGAWSVAVPLQLGANTLTATVADADGNSAHATRTVRYATPSSPPPKPKPSNQFTFTVKKLKRGAKSVTVIVKLPGRGSVRAKLTGAGKTLARASKAAKAKGSVTVKLRLTRKAFALIRKRHKVKAKLAVTFTPTGGTARTKTKRLTPRA